MHSRKLTIARKGLLVLLLPLVYQAVLLGMLIKRQRDQATAQDWVVHTKNVLGQLDRVQLSMLQLQGSLRGHLITRNPEFVTEAEVTLKALPQQLATLKSLTANNQESRFRVARVEELVNERVAWHHSVSNIVAEGKWDEALEKVRALEGKHMMDALGVEVEEYRQAAERLDRMRLAELHETTKFQDRLLVGGLILNVALGVGAVLFVGRSLTHRVDLLTANALRFSRGEELLPAAKGNDELAELDRTFHDMVGGLADGQRRERAFQAVLERRNGELERANRDLDHKNQENEMFVYSVSHDLRSPLVNLQGFSKELGLTRDDLRLLFENEVDDRARTRGRKLVDRDITESIHYIQTAVMRLSTIIDALLRLSRAGRVDYQPEVVDLEKVTARIVTSLRGSINEKQAEVVVGTLPPAWGDATAIEQVFANLLANAVNYLDPQRPGRIEVGVCDVPPPAAVGRPTWYVKDNGLGIADAYLPKVFAIFQRLHSHAAQGEGVGLTLVRRMVERHGGHIWVESEAGAGSTFFVALPEKEQSPLVIAPKKESIKLTGPTPIT